MDHEDTSLTEAGAALLRAFRESEGGTAPISVGSVRLANIIADEGAAADRLIAFVGGARSIARMIGGTMAPCQSWGEELGRLTGGTLRSSLFLQDWTGELPDAAPKPAAAEVVPLPSRRDAEIEHLATVRGRIGQTPVGRLFDHVIDPMNANGFVVTGLGMAFSLDEATGFALKDAIVEGLMAVRTASARAEMAKFDGAIEAAGAR